MKMIGWAALGFVLTLLVVGIGQVTLDAIRERRKALKLYDDWARAKAGRK